MELLDGQPQPRSLPCRLSDLRLAIGVGDTQGRPINADGDAVMLQAIEQRIDQRFALEKVVPIGVVEI